MKIRKHVSYTTEIDEGVFPTTFEPIDTPITEINGNRSVLGYLIVDESCPNPLTDCDGMGSIYNLSNRRGSWEDRENAHEALGLNSEGSPDLELDTVKDATAKHIIDYCIKAILDRIPEDVRPRLIDYDYFYEMSGTAKLEIPGGDVIEREFEVRHEYEWIAQFHFLSDSITPPNEENVAMIMWERGRKNGTIGNPYAVALDVYEHGGVSYSVSGEGVQCMWDTSRGGAVWVPDDALMKEIAMCPEEDRQARVVEFARQACEAYTSWCNGECYDTVVEWFERSNEGSPWEQVNYDCCGGHIGHDWAEEALGDVFQEKVQEWLKGGTPIESGDRQ